MPPRATTGIDMPIDYCRYGQGSRENLSEGTQIGKDFPRTME
jgi:hypothetical protein